MNVLFFYIGVPSPIFETELELIKIHSEKGDKVRVLICNGDLPNCFWNPEKKEYICNLCRSKRVNGFKLLTSYPNIEYYYFRKHQIKHTIFDIKNVQELLDFNYDNENLGIGVASRLISFYRDHRFPINDNLKQVKLELNSAIQTYENLKYHIEVFNPDLVYIFNGRVTSYLAATLLCKKFKIKYYTYEIATTPNRYLLRENSTSHDILKHHEEMNTLWNMESNNHFKESKAKEYFEKRRKSINIQKTETYTIDQKPGTLPNNFDQTKINIGIFNSSIDEYFAVKGWENNIYEPDETNGIRLILDEFKNNEAYNFYLRVHPNLRKLPKSTSQLRDLREIEIMYDNITIIWPESEVDSYTLLDACNKIIVFASTIGVEAAFWGKPVILAGRSLYENLGCVYTPKSHEEVIHLIQDINLKPLNSKLALKYAFREISHGIDFKFFKETKIVRGLSVGKFMGVKIKPNLIPNIIYKINIYAIAILNKIKKYVLKCI
jgi:hypothetical protein